MCFHNEYSKAPSIKYPKDQLTLASRVFVAINKSYFSVFAQLKEMTLQLASTMLVKSWFQVTC